LSWLKKGKERYTISMVMKIGLEEVEVEVEEELEIGIEEGVEVEETKIFFDFPFSMKIQLSQ